MTRPPTVSTPTLPAADVAPDRDGVLSVAEANSKPCAWCGRRRLIFGAYCSLACKEAGIRFEAEVLNAGGAA